MGLNHLRSPTFFLALPPDLFTGSLSFLADFPASFFFLSSLGGCGGRAGTHAGHHAAPRSLTAHLPASPGLPSSTPGQPSPCRAEHSLAAPGALLCCVASPAAQDSQDLKSPRLHISETYHHGARRAAATTTLSSRCRTERKRCSPAGAETVAGRKYFRGKGRSHEPEVRRRGTRLFHGSRVGKWVHFSRRGPELCLLGYWTLPLAVVR